MGSGGRTERSQTPARGLTALAAARVDDVPGGARPAVGGAGELPLPVAEGLWILPDRLEIDTGGVPGGGAADGGEARERWDGPQTPRGPGRAVPAVLPARAGLAAMCGFLVVLLCERLLLRAGAPVVGNGPALVVGCVVVQYLAMAGLVVAISRRWGSGSVRADLGLGLARAELRDGVLGWLAGVGLVAALGALLQRLAVPTATNNPVMRGSGAPRVDLPPWMALALAAVVMAVVAPVLEELLFRGVLLRALRGRLPTGAALGVQALVFGLFHADIRRGVANIGLVAILATVGLVLGVLTERHGGRLGPAMVAHGLHNGMAFLIGLDALR